MNQAIRLYNSLPPNIRSMERGKKQKNDLKSWTSINVRFKP